MKKSGCVLLLGAALLLTNTATAQTDTSEAENEIHFAQFDCPAELKTELYRDAVALERAGRAVAAKALYCAMALYGDDRAQYKYAKALFESAHNHTDTVAASALAMLANMAFRDLKKERLITDISAQLQATDRELRDDLLAQLVENVGTGRRLDNRNTLTDADLERLRNRKQLYTGSRIKRKDAKLLPLRQY